MSDNDVVGVISLSLAQWNDPPRKVLRKVTSVRLVPNLGMRFGMFRYMKADYYCFQPFAGKDVAWYYIVPSSPLMYHATKALKGDTDE